MHQPLFASIPIIGAWILNGKGSSDWLWWFLSCFLLFRTGQFNIIVFLCNRTFYSCFNCLVCFVASVYYIEWWRTSPSVSFRVSRSFKTKTNKNRFVHYTYQHMLCLVATVYCTHVGSATVSFRFSQVNSLTTLVPGIQWQSRWVSLIRSSTNLLAYVMDLPTDYPFANFHQFSLPLPVFMLVCDWIEKGIVVDMHWNIWNLPVLKCFFLCFF